MILKEWAVLGAYFSEVYLAPEDRPKARLIGYVYNHPSFEDGTHVTTSEIVNSTGREIQTETGSVYLLFGPPDKNYQDWLNSYDLVLDQDNPIKILERDRQTLI